MIHYLYKNLSGITHYLVLAFKSAPPVTKTPLLEGFQISSQKPAKNTRISYYLTWDLFLKVLKIFLHQESHSNISTLMIT